jgi:hypothetical protein
MTEAEQANKALVTEAFHTLFNRRDYATAQRFWSPHLGRWAGSAGFARLTCCDLCVANPCHFRMAGGPPRRKWAWSSPR